MECRAAAAVVVFLLNAAACTSASSGPRTIVVTYPEGLPGNDTTVYPPTPDAYAYVPPILVAPIDDATADTDSGLIEVTVADTSDAGLDAHGVDVTAPGDAAADASATDAADAAGE